MTMKLHATLAAGVGACLAVTLAAVPASAETVLTFGGSDAIGSLLDRANKRFSEEVTERSGGEIKVNFIQGEQLGADIQVIEQMMQNSVQMYGDVLGWYANWVPDLAILNWGFTFDDNDHMQKFLSSEVYGKLIEDLREKTGLRVLAAAPTQPRNLFANKPIESPDGLSGVKMRVPEIQTYLLLWETLGAQPSRVAWAEVFLGLKTGTIDAAEGPVSAAYAAKFHEAVPYVMRTDHLISTYHITMNDDAFEALDPDAQELLVTVAEEVTQWTREQAEAETLEIIQSMADEGATIVEVDKGAFADKALAGVAEMEEDGVWSEGLWQQIRDLND